MEQPTHVNILNFQTYRTLIRPLKDTEYGGGFKARKLNRWIQTMEGFIMPGKAKKTGLQKNGFTTTFVNYKLSSSEKADFIKWLSRKDGETQVDFQDAMSKGHKFSISENSEQGFFLGSMTCRDDASINYDMCITSRSPDWWEALMLCVYKAQQMGYDAPWSDQGDSNDWG